MSSLARTVMRHRSADFQRAEIRSAAGEVVVDAGQAQADIDGSRTLTELEVKVRGLVECPRVRTRRRHFHKDVVVHEDAVFVLARGIAVFLERFESPNFSRFRFELSLLLRRKLSVLAR